MTQPEPNQAAHCRRFGHPVTLAYCARESIDLPCQLVDQCWEGRTSVRDYLLTMYSESRFEALQKPTSKLASIIDIINQARESAS
jgi:hypothetical protein